MTARTTGTVKFYHPDRGFGFITADGRDVFLHLADWRSDGNPLKNDRVTFLHGAGRDGRPKAVDVMRVDD